MMFGVKKCSLILCLVLRVQVTTYVDGEFDRSRDKRAKDSDNRWRCQILDDRLIETLKWKNANIHSFLIQLRLNIHGAMQSLY